MTTALATAPANGVAKTEGQSKQISNAQQFRSLASNIAGQMLKDWVGEDRANEAIGRISAALTASAASARDPSDFYACTPASIATCIAISALTGLMPGVGSSALAYVIPQRARSGELPQLQYSLSHRGLNALARRCGQTMVAVPIGAMDVISSNEDGEVMVVSRNIDAPPTTFEELRGVIVLVKELSTGRVLTRGWMPKSLIEKRRAMSRSWNGNGQKYSPWFNWPVEQAIKTAIHYAIGRGWCVIDDTDAGRALSADQDGDLLPAPQSVIESPRIQSLSKSDQLVSMLDKQQQGVTEVEESQETQKGDGSEAIALWQPRIDACKTAKELEAEYPRFDAVRGELDKETGDKIEAAFAARLSSFADKK